MGEQQADLGGRCANGGRPSDTRAARNRAIHVRAPIDLPALDLLRCHVVDRAQKLAALDQAPPRPPAWSARSRRGKRGPGLRAAVTRTLPGFTSRCTRPGVGRRPGRRRPGQREPRHGEVRASLPLRACSQVASLHKAHGDEEDALDLSRAVDRDHVRVVDRGGELRLAQEAFAKAPIPGQNE